MSASTLQKALAVQNLPEVSHSMRSEAQIVISKIRAEEKRHAEQMANLDEMLKITVWNSIENHWDKAEIAAALEKVAK